MRKNNKGFTLIEMLIVVAIIAILIAVSIPLVSTSLERARQATDAANERAAKAEATIMYLNNEWTAGAKAYDAALGTFGEGTTYTGKEYGKCKTHENGHIIATITDGNVSISWSVGGTTLHSGNLETTS